MGSEDLKRLLVNGAVMDRGDLEALYARIAELEAELSLVNGVNATFRHDLESAEAERDGLREAIRLTREYVGEEVLPAIPGWTWYDAMMATGGWQPQEGGE